MKPVRMRVDRIIDFGTVVSLVGVETETDRPVSVHVDYRPFSVFRKALRQAGLAPPIEYEADRLLLHLDMLPFDGADGVRLVEIAHSSAICSRAGRPSVRGQDR
jgi:hypothetical protein